MNRLISAAIIAALGSVPAIAGPLWLRNSAISPDGNTIAFTYKGDIYTVGAKGGSARQITSNSAYDSEPVWSPDGSKIAFSSTREGSSDIYVVDAKGGTPRRITTHSGSESPRAWLNDSTILFNADIMPSRVDLNAPFALQTYTVGIGKDKPTRPELFLSLQTTAMSVDPATGAILYEDRKGYENVWRKHERSSSTGDVILYRDGKFERQTTFDGNDRNPVWTGSDGSYAYLSEEDGTLNVYAAKVGSKEKRQLTKFTKHPVRSLSASADGKTMAFSWDGELYTLRPGSEPVKIEVDITADDYATDVQKSIRRSGATAFDVAPSGEEIAFVLRGDVYVTSVKYNTTKQITNTPAQERCVSFSADGRTLVYDSERDGIWQLFTSKIKNDSEKNFTYATEIVEEPLYKSEKTAQQPVFSPDGKKVAFLEDRTTLRVIDPASKEVHTALDGKYNYSYSDGDISFEWSPDSRWFLIDYIGNGGWNNTDIALVSEDGKTVVDLTESGYSDYNAKWALGGKAITYSTGRFGMKSHGSWGNQSDILFMALDGEAWDKMRMTEEEADLADKAKEEADKEKAEKDDKKDKKDKKSKKGKKDESKDETEALVFDTANRRYRMMRLTGPSGMIGDYFLSPKGDKLYYVAQATDGETNLYEKDLRKDEVKVLAGDIYGGIVPDKKGENIFAVSGSGIKKIDLASGSAKAVEFEAPYDRRPASEREYIYDHAWQQVKDKFYDEKLHGVDWEAYGEHYRKFLPYISNNTDFAILLSEILGELNASHTGGRYYGGGASMSTASLGAYFDPSYGGDGLLIAEVIARGPLSTKAADIAAGDIITSIDGTPVLKDMDYFPLLEGKSGKKTRLGIRKASGEEKSVEIKPISQGRLGSLIYDRWVERNEAFVDSISGGRIGYVHIQGMDSPSFRTIYDRLLGKYRNCDAVVVDTRFNGGGWLHNDVAQLLSGKEYVRFTPRGQYIGSEPFSQWTKPSVMLVNEANYSDAYGTPYTYQALKIGDLVGAPVPGTMTAVWWETQIDPTIVFGIPQVTSLDMKGEALENKQLIPEVIIYNTPADIVSGNDAQLRGAVEVLLKKTQK